MLRSVPCRLRSRSVSMSNRTNMELKRRSLRSSVCCFQLVSMSNRTNMELKQKTTVDLIIYLLYIVSMSNRTNMELKLVFERVSIVWSLGLNV